jgi:lipid-binding SYLF domain-containing protein
MARLLTAIAAMTVLCASSFVAPTRAAGDSPAEDRREALEQAQKASRMFDEIMNIREDGIPEELLKDAEVIAVFPDVFKAAFIFGGSGGKGVVSSRDPNTGRWGPPLFLKVGGASWGAQIGAESADLVMVGVNRDAEKVFQKEEWTIGAEAGVAAGPVGRKARVGTDYKLDSQWVSYSRSKGLFAGLSLGGAKVALDGDVNRAVYGTNVRPMDVLRGRAEPGAGAAGVMIFPQTLAKYGRPMPD